MALAVVSGQGMMSLLWQSLSLQAISCKAMRCLDLRTQEANPDRRETLSHLERGIPIDDVTPDKMGARPLKYNATLISSIEIGSLGVVRARESRKDPIGKLA